MLWDQVSYPAAGPLPERPGLTLIEVTLACLMLAVMAVGVMTALAAANEGYHCCDAAAGNCPGMNNGRHYDFVQIEIER